MKSTRILAVLVLFLVNPIESRVLEEVPQVFWKTLSIPVITGYTDLRINLTSVNPCSIQVNQLTVYNPSNLTGSDREEWLRNCTDSWNASMARIERACWRFSSFNTEAESMLADKNRVFDFSVYRRRNRTLPEPKPYLGAVDLLETDWYTKQKPKDFAAAISQQAMIYKSILDDAELTGNEDAFTKEFTKGIKHNRDWSRKNCGLFSRNCHPLEHTIWDFIQGHVWNLDNLNKICSDNNMTVCESQTWRVQGCEASSNKIQLRMIVPKQAPEYKLVQAVPFEYFTKEGPKWCRHYYIGPQTGITWRNGNNSCFRPVILNPETQFFENFRPLPEDCNSSIDEASFWRKGDCFAADRNPNTVKYVKLEKYGIDFYLHCYGSVIRLRGSIFDCPVKPFVIRLFEEVEVDGKMLFLDEANLRQVKQQQSLTDEPVVVEITTTALET